MQLKIGDYDDKILEWIPYNQFDNIKEVSNNDLSTIYSAKWIGGPLSFDLCDKKYIRKSSKEVTLKCSHNLHNIDNIDKFLNEV
jgi:hypothetical protein